MVTLLLARGTSTREVDHSVGIIVPEWELEVQVDRALACVDTFWLASVGERIVVSGKLARTTSEPS